MFSVRILFSVTFVLLLKLQNVVGTVTTGSCAPYSASNTQSAEVNYATCYISICGGDELEATICGAGTGDTYLRLFTPSGSQIESNDDACGVLSTLTYYSNIGNSCMTYALHQGCYSSTSCSGTVSYTITSSTRSPTMLPTVYTPPTTNAPTISNVQYCPSYAISTTTDSATVNYDICTVNLCPGDEITMGMCFPGMVGNYGDTYIRLYDTVTNTQEVYNDDSCGVLSQLSYTAPMSMSSCRDFELREGCFSANMNCGGRVGYQITTHGSRPPTAAPTRVPTAVPTLKPSLVPTPSPSAFVSSCPAYSAINTNSATVNTVECVLNMCPGDTLDIGCCDYNSCSGDTFLRLLDKDGTQISYSDDQCGVASEIKYTMPFRAATCEDVVVEQGCFDSNSCSGTLHYTLSNPSNDDVGSQGTVFLNETTNSYQENLIYVVLFFTLLGIVVCVFILNVWRIYFGLPDFINWLCAYNIVVISEESSAGANTMEFQTQSHPSLPPRAPEEVRPVHPTAPPSYDVAAGTVTAAAVVELPTATYIDKSMYTNV